MNRILLALMMVLCSVASAQLEVVYPYNPDGNADSVISAPDLLDLLPIFGGSFTPEEITVNGEGLSTVLEEMQSALDSLMEISSDENACPQVNLSGSTLANQWLEQVNLSGANLSGVNLSNTTVIDSDLSDVNLSDANLSSVFLGDVQLTGSNLSGADCSFMYGYNLDFSHSNLSGANFDYSSFEGSVGPLNFSYANLTGSSWHGAIAAPEINLSYATLSSADLSGAELTHADLSYANFSEVDLTYAILYGANFLGVDLTQVLAMPAIQDNMRCLINCPSALPDGFFCEPDTNCFSDDRFRIVPE
jgi:uncharacterized protein YjbI with pentapeptide repeats